MSKEIAQTVGGKRIAWLIAIVAAFAVFATIGSQFSAASAATLDAANSQTVSESRTDSSVVPSMNLPDIRGSTASAVHSVVGFTTGTIDSIVSAVNNSPIAGTGFWAFVAVTIAFVVLFKTITLGPLTQPAEPRYVRRQDLGMYGHRARAGNPPNSFAGRSTWLRTTDNSRISKRFGLKRASHTTAIAMRTTPAWKIVATSIWNITSVLAHKTATVLTRARGAVHSSARSTWNVAVGAFSVISYYARITANGDASIRISSSAHRIGAGFAYPIIAPIAVGHNFAISRITAAATSGESELLHKTNTEHGRTIARGSPSSSMHQEWQPKPAAFVLQI